MRYWKLVVAILFMIPVVGTLGYLLWLALPTFGQVVMQLYRSPGTRIILGVFIFAVVIISLLAASLHFWEGFKTDSWIDDLLKKNLKPEVYKAYREQMGFKSMIKRWWHGDRSKKQTL